MTIKEVLTKTVLQALQGGWDIFDGQRDKRAAWPPESVTVTEASDSRQGWDLFIGHPHIYEHIADSWAAEDLLFDLKFARALWGEDWGTKLAELLLSEDRWEYLEEHLS